MRMTTLARLETLLVPVDFSESCGKAVALAIDLAKTVGASVELLHVVPRPVYPALYGGFVPNTMVDYEAMMEEAARGLAAVAAELSDAGVPVSTEVTSGAPHDAIVERAAATGADMIVMATHGLTGLDHALMGSVAERVVRMAPCPVLTTAP